MPGNKKWFAFKDHHAQAVKSTSGTIYELCNGALRQIDYLSERRKITSDARVYLINTIEAIKAFNGRNYDVGQMALIESGYEVDFSTGPDSGMEAYFNGGEINGKDEDSPNGDCSAS